MTRTNRPRETYGIYIDIDSEPLSERELNYLLESQEAQRAYEYERDARWQAERANEVWEEKCKRLENICACQEKEIEVWKRKVQNEQEKAEISKAVADQHIAALTRQLEKKKKHRTLGDRVLQTIGFWVGIIYWLENMDGH